jgi:nucleotide-binding universal stress UspA family protein
MRILLAVDGSAYTKKMLAYLANHPDLLGPLHEYTALTVTPPLPAQARTAVGKGVADGFYADEAEKVLAPVLKFLKRQGIAATRMAKVGKPGETVAKVADANRFDLIVMGSHGHGALAGLVLGSVATRVLAHTSVPVLLVR